MQKAFKTSKRLLLFVLICMLYIGEFQSVFANTDSENRSKTNSILESLPSKSLRVPSPILGLKIISLDKYYRRITLHWLASPAVEKVDSYAIYSQDALKPRNLGMQLNGVTKGTTFTLKTWNPGTGVQPPHSVVMELGYFSEFWVIAHNKYGWGETVGGAYPANSKPPTLSRSQQIADYPDVVSQNWTCTEKISLLYPGQCS